MNDRLQAVNGGFRTKLEHITPLVDEIPAEPLGPFGDIPVAYAVFQAALSENSDRVVRSHFIYASPEYCNLINCEAKDILGFSHLEVVKNEASGWPEMCTKAVVHGEPSNGVFFSQITQSWVSFSIIPSTVEGCFVYALMTVDEQERVRQMSIDAKTAQITSELLATLAGEVEYESAINAMLEHTAGILNPDRINIFECNGPETKSTFEWCAKGVEPIIGSVVPLPIEVIKAWFKSVSDDPVALIPDTAVIERYSKPLYDWCVMSGIHNLLAAPFFNEGEMIGFLGVYNYRIDGSIDVNRVFAPLSSFVGARIENHRLIENLAWSSEHDVLTGLLNRRGSNALLAKSIKGNPTSELALVIIDLDDLKGINDRNGHVAGDSALEAMGRYIKTSFPADAIASRSGGDEFIVGLRGESASRIEEFLDSFSSLDMEYEHEGVRHTLTASIGFACYPEQASSLNELYSNADKALYTIKRGGKAGYAKYDPSME